MNNIVWLLEKDIFDNIDGLKAAINRKGLKHISASYAGFESKIRADRELTSDDEVICYGSLQFISAVTRSFPKTFPWIWCSKDKLTCNYYYPRLQNFILNQEHLFLPYGILKKRKNWLFKTLGEDGCIFVRPNSGMKTFTGTVIEYKFWERTIDKCGFYGINDEELCVVARPRNLIQEFRFVIGPERNIVASTQYNTEVEKPLVYQGVTDFANKVLSHTDYQPDAFWTLDIGQTKDRTFHVIECNSFSAAGLYHCDMDKIVDATHKYVNEQI